MVEQLTLYTNDISPFSHRVEIAFAEAGIEEKVIRHEVPLTVLGQDKPSWFSEKVNPIGLVPTLAYGAQAAPDQPSDSSAKIYESAAIVDFIAELYPNSKLLPSDLVQRAKARAFSTASNTLILTGWRDGVTDGNFESLYKALTHIQALIPDGSKFAVGNEFTVADASIVPWLARLELLLENDLFGKHGKGAGLKAFEVYNSAKYAKLRAYSRSIQEWPSVKKTYLKDVAYKYFSDKLTPK